MRKRRWGETEAEKACLNAIDVSILDFLDYFVHLLAVLSFAPDHLPMVQYEPRDRSGPMDVDNHDPIDRLSQFALHDPEEGPSRKRELKLSDRGDPVLRITW